jgi:hypothetical protein
VAGKSHTSSSPRRKERRAQLWNAQQKRKEERRVAGAAAAKKNRELRSQGLETPTQKWEPVKERAAEARQRRSEARKQSQFHQRMGGIGKLDRRTNELRRAWRAMAAGRPDVFA